MNSSRPPPNLWPEGYEPEPPADPDNWTWTVHSDLAGLNQAIHARAIERLDIAAGLRHRPDMPQLHNFTSAQTEQLREANRTKIAPSYNALFEKDWPTFSLEKSKPYLRGRELAWKNHVAENEIAKLPCNHVTEDMAKIFISTLDLGQDGRKKLKQTFERLSKRAVKAGQLPYCPFADVKLTKDRTTEDRKKFYHPETEYPLILKHARNDDAREYFGFSMGAGTRPAESKHFDWADVDMENSRLTFRYGGGEDGATKSGKPATVPMVAEAKQWLQHRIDRLHDGTKPDSGIIFGYKNRLDRAYKKRDYDFGLMATLKAAGLKSAGRGLYGFRHGFCVALANGYFGDHWSRAEAREMMRHSNEKTLDYYFRVLKHRLAEKAAETKPLSNVADYGTDDDDDDSSGSGGGTPGSSGGNPITNGVSRRTNPSESFLKRKGATRHGRQWSVSRLLRTSTKTILP